MHTRSPACPRARKDGDELPEKHWGSPQRADRDVPVSARGNLISHAASGAIFPGRPCTTPACATRSVNRHRRRRPAACVAAGAQRHHRTGLVPPHPASLAPCARAQERDQLPRRAAAPNHRVSHSCVDGSSRGRRSHAPPAPFSSTRPSLQCCRPN